MDNPFGEPATLPTAAFARSKAANIMYDEDAFPLHLYLAEP